MIIGNAFSLQMVGPTAQINVSLITSEEVSKLPLESVIGHVDTAFLVGKMLGQDLPANRANVTLKPGDSMIVAQYIGPRLPEGAKELPFGARIEFRLVKVN